MEDRYNVRATEAKWQKRWEDEKSFEVTEDAGKEKYYVLAMFPYPSGKLHVGHMRNYTMTDIVARYKRAKGYNVMNPMGWDAFGLPAENAAIENGAHPEKWTYGNAAAMKKDLQLMGLAIDWSREIATCAPEYYRHEQKFFLDFLKNGLAYQKESYVNWDPVENTVLANEQVVDGKGWRSGAPVERRLLKQWFLRITDFADDLLAGLDTLDGWPEKVRLMQENWIGRSIGAEFVFDLVGDDRKIDVFTTRPDTLFGASFVAISADHDIAKDLAAKNADAQAFIDECRKTGTSAADIETAEKKGFDTGLLAKHPFIEGQTLPVYIANFVLMDYGTGALFACPAHDQRDLDFARKYNLPVLPVVLPHGADAATFTIGDEAYTGDGTLINSGFLDGLEVPAAKKAAIDKLTTLKQGFGTTIYRLRDWGVSRQRYWGCPVPIIHCPSCGIVPVPDDQLPVTLPPDVDFSKPGNPIANHPTWKHTTCPTCQGKAERETDTFDTFFESSWYQFRYCDPRNDKIGFAKDKVQYWAPVDQYVGGIEHAVMHLLYARFFTRALKKCGYLDFDEPFKALFTQGMVIHETFKGEDGKWLYPEDVITGDNGQFLRASDRTPVTLGRIEKMSKSKKNVIGLQDVSENYGVDAARLLVLSDSPPDRDVEWTQGGIEGAWKYVGRLHRLVTNADLNGTGGDIDDMRRRIHQSIMAVTDDYERFHFNKAIARLRELSNALESFASKKGDGKTLREGLEALVILMNPLMPHLAEELWEKLGHTTLLVNTPWPVADAKLAENTTVTMGVQVNGKLRATLQLPKDCDAKAAEAAAMNDDNVVRALDGKQPKKIIVVPNRIINVVV